MFFFPIELCVVLLWSIEGGLISLLGSEGSTLSLWWNGLEVGGCWPTCVLLRCSLGECLSLTPSCLHSAGCWSRVPVYLHRQSLFTPSHLPPHLHTKPESGLHFLFFLSFIIFLFLFFFKKNLPQTHSKMSSVSVWGKKKAEKTVTHDKADKQLWRYAGESLWGCSGEGQRWGDCHETSQ